MKNTLLLIILIAMPFIGTSQGCEYGSSADASELCDFNSGNRFANNRNAEIALDKILDVTGMSKRFAIIECNSISNCVATAYKGIRYILYNKDFMDGIATSTDSWSNLSILAHEIGHHVNGHSLDLIVYASGAIDLPTLSEKRQMEIEADEYSGFVMYKLGATLDQAQQAIRLVSNNKDDMYSTHPSLDKRLEAIERGYNNAMESNIDNNVYSSTRNAAEYFYNAYNNESDWYYQIENYTKCLLLEPEIYTAYINRGVAYQNVGRCGDALNDFTIALMLKPNNSVAYSYKSGAYVCLKDYSKAISDASLAIELDPNSAKAYRERGTAYFALNNFPKATNDLSMAIYLDPKDGKAYFLRGSIKKISGSSWCSDYKKACDLSGIDFCCNEYYKSCR